MKKLPLVILVIVSMFTLISCEWGKKTTNEDDKFIEQAILEEMEKSFYFFYEQANTDPDSPGYGLIRDRYPDNSSIASIASVGFGLTAIPIGIENGWITYDEGKTRVIGTLHTLRNIEHHNGFYYHFVNINTGKREWNSEVSSIDTALLMAGVLFVGEYFGDEVKTLASELYERVNWNWFVDKNKNMFYMSYYPDRTPSFQDHWDFYAEQLILYFLASGTPNETYRIDPVVYYSFIRDRRAYKGEPFIHSWFGSLFTYQYSHAWIDFRDIVDKQGVNWFENSVHATIANRQYAIDMANQFKTFSENSWGMTACDGPNGYSGLYGAKPSGYTDDAHKNDGTIPPSGAIGSIVFLEKEVKEAIRYFETIEGLKGKYGYKDSYNFEGKTPWIASNVIGINKGITLLMLQNYRDEFVWKTFMKNEYIQQAIINLEFTTIYED